MRLWSKRRLSSVQAPTDWIASRAWIAWEAPRNYVAGEASYTAALQAVAGPVCEDGYCRPVEVRFVREPRNQYDRNAFRAEVDGQLIGYLRRHIAAQVALALDGGGCRSFVVPGLLRGGSTRTPHVGCHVWLDRCLSPTGLVIELPPPERQWAVPWPLHELELSRLS